MYTIIYEKHINEEKAIAIFEHILDQLTGNPKLMKDGMKILSFNTSFEKNNVYSFNFKTKYYKCSLFYREADDPKDMGLMLRVEYTILDFAFDDNSWRKLLLMDNEDMIIRIVK